MKLLIKIFLILLITFSSTFVILKLTDSLTVEKIKFLFESIRTMSPLIIGLLVAGLLMIDLYLSIPTLAVVIFSGFFMGFIGGAIASSIGLLLAGTFGYWLSWKFGERLIKKLSGNEKEFVEMQNIFNSNAKVVLVLCRALPMLPEISSCLAGINKMPFKQYLFWYTLGSIPYVIIASYSGSVSDIDNPWPAIYAAIGILGLMSVIWLFIIKRKLTSN
jgi:uncharacterized membrane protein YdjX (TVP38/TMEM64 family)